MTENLPGDDVEGHAFRKAADTERDETGDDVSGHVAHLSGPFDPKR